MKYLVIVLAVLLLAVPAMAATTGTTLFHSHSYTDNDTCNYVDKYSEYQVKQNWPLGIGADVTLYEFDGALNQVYGLDSVNTEVKYDISNGGMSAYGVVHVNAWRVVRNLMK